ncbi:uncharacterized protein [Panulirus ornatus]
MKLAKQHEKIIYDKFSDGDTSGTKVKKWQSITQHIIATSPSVEQVQRRYYIIYSGKNKIATQKRLFCETDAVAEILGADSPSIIGISGLNSYDSVTDDSCEDTTRTCTIMIPPPQSSHESLPSGSMLMQRPMSTDWGQNLSQKSNRPRN